MHVGMILCSDFFAAASTSGQDYIWKVTVFIYFVLYDKGKGFCLSLCHLWEKGWKLTLDLILSHSNMIPCLRYCPRPILRRIQENESSNCSDHFRIWTGVFLLTIIHSTLKSWHYWIKKMGILDTGIETALHFWGPAKIMFNLGVDLR